MRRVLLHSTNSIISIIVRCLKWAEEWTQIEIAKNTLRWDWFQDSTLFGSNVNGSSAGPRGSSTYSLQDLLKHDGGAALKKASGG